jgi:RNA polymerase sigma-70 factor (ECF subfamily)
MGATRANEPEERTADLEELEAARSGDHEACRRLLARHGGSMMKTAWRVLGRYGAGDGDDVVQEALIAALTTTARPVSELGPWLRAITARKAIDHLRRIGRKKEDPLPEPDGSAEPVAPERTESTLDVWMVRKALGQLSAADRAVLTLVDLEGHSMAEAARALGLTRVAVKLRAVRARRKLARLIDTGSERKSVGEAAG